MSQANPQAWFHALGDLFAPRKPEPSQAEHLERVSVRIGAAIVDFCRARVGKEFHADELREHVDWSIADLDQRRSFP